jgi:hypothetical protein
MDTVFSDNRMFYDLPIREGITFGFQSNIVLSDYSYVFKYDYDNKDTSKKCTLASNDKDVILNYIKKTPKDKKHFYELIPNDVPVKEYYDIDFKVSDPSKDSDDWSEETIASLLEARNNIVEYPKLSNKDIIVLSSHTPTKFSLHIISKKSMFKNNQVQKLVMSEIADELERLRLGFNIDLSVYSKNRPFRVKDSTKRGKQAYLTVYNPTKYNFASFEESLIRITSERRLSGTPSGRLSGRDGASDFKFVEQSVDGRLYNSEEYILKQENHIIDDIDLTGEKDIDAFLKDHPEFKIRTGCSQKGVIVLDRVSRTKCIGGEEMHSTQNARIYSHLGKFYFKCFCEQSKKVSIGYSSTPVESPYKIEENPLITHKVQNKIPIDVYRKLVEEVHSVFDCRNMGSGKTYNAIHRAKELLEQSKLLQDALKKYRKIVFISHRITLDKYIVFEYNATSYKNKNFDKIDTDMVSIVINSLDKKFSEFDDYEIIIFDEISSLMRQLDMKDIKSTTILTFFRIISSFPRQIIFMDANMDAKLIEDISKIRHLYPSRVVIGNSDNEPQFRLQVHSIPNCNQVYDSHFIDFIIKNDYSQHKIIIPTNLGIDTRMQALKKLILKFQPYLKILEISKDTRNSIDLSDEEFLATEYDVIIYSPTISEGYSFNSKAWKNHTIVGIFTNQSCGPETCCQMIRRFRAVQDYKVILATNPYTPLYRDEKEYYQYATKHLSTVLEENRTIRIGYDNSYKPVIETNDIFWKVHSENQVKKEIGKANFQRVFKQMATNNLFLVEEFANPSKKVDFLLWSELVCLSEGELTREIANSTLISRQEYELIKSDKKADCSKKTSLEIKKFSIHSTLNLETDNSEEAKNNIDYGYWEKSKNRRAFNNLKSLFSFVRGVDGPLVQIPTKDVLNANLVKRKERIEDKPDHFAYKKNDIRLSEVEIKYIFDEFVVKLGFNNIPCWNPPTVQEYKTNMAKLKSDLTFAKYKEICHMTWKNCNTEDFNSLKAPPQKKKRGNGYKTDNFVSFVKCLMSLLGCKIYESRKDGFAYIVCNFWNIELCKDHYPKITEMIPDEGFEERYDGFFHSESSKLCKHCNEVVSCLQWYNHTRSDQHQMNLKKEVRTYPLECSNCGIGFDCPKKLVEHLFKDCICKSEKDEQVCQHECGVEIEETDKRKQKAFWREHYKTCLTNHEVENRVSDESKTNEDDKKENEPSSKFGCQECNREFSTKQKLQNHIQVCGKEKEKKQYKCEECDKDFGGHKGHWKKHMKSIHNIEA